MTNNRKPADEVRLSWDAKAAFKSLNAQGKRRQASIDDERLKTTPYTPPPNVAAWLKAQADKPKGRDYEAILRAAKKAPVGYYEDAPHGIKFGGQPLPSASTKPHGKDVDTADGPWPKCLTSNDGTGVIVYTCEHDKGTFYGERAQKWKFRKRYADALAEQPFWSLKQRFALPLADAIAKLEQNGHKDAAAQLRGKPRPAETAGHARAYLENKWWYRVRIGERVWFKRHPDNKTPIFEHGWHEQHFGCGMEPVNAGECIKNRGGVELHGAERDAIIAECRKATGL